MSRVPAYAVESAQRQRPVKARTAQVPKVVALRTRRRAAAGLAQAATARSRSRRALVRAAGPTAGKCGRGRGWDSGQGVVQMASGGGGDGAAPPVSQALIKLVHQAKTTIDPDYIGALCGRETLRRRR